MTDSPHNEVRPPTPAEVARAEAAAARLRRVERDPRERAGRAGGAAAGVERAGGHRLAIAAALGLRALWAAA